MKPVFQWSPDLGAQQEMAPSVQVTKFGDGYELRTPMGINNKPRMWQVRFTCSPAKFVELEGFLEARGGSEAFTWTDPLGREGTYVCRKWSTTRQGMGGYVLSGTFEQVFEV